MMTDKKEDAIWPLPKISFKVTWGDTIMKFSEVIGLDTEDQIVEYRHGDDKKFRAVKMPGINKRGNVTMRRGVFLGDIKYWAWYDKIKMDTMSRQTVTIALLNEKEQLAMTWTLKNAWPTKITSTDLKSNDNEEAIDTLEVAFESMTIKNS